MSISNSVKSYELLILFTRKYFSIFNFNTFTFLKLAET